MKVKELQKLLKTKDGEMEVILQKDAEGNGFSPLEDVYEAAYEPDNSWSGWVIDDDDVDEDDDFVVVLVPIN